MPASAPGETYGELLVLLDQLAREAMRLGDDAISEWTELAQLDAIDLGEQLGLLSDVAAFLPGGLDSRPTTKPRCSGGSRPTG